MWVKDGKNNETGWHNDEYDRLIDEAARARDPQERLRMLKKAENILLEELPIIPFYYYVKTDMVRDYVKGWHGNALDVHPLDALTIDAAQRAEERQSEGLR
jgi:oligopeptide transport system substrate-binding protein